MGGIVGTFRWGGSADRATLVRQTELLTERGPDDGAIYLEGPFALGHRRLDIEGRGHQPHWDEEGRIGVVFDGELDGAEELAGGLAARGHVLGDAPEGSTLVVAAYREWGDACVEHLEGSFAFALLDRRSKQMLVARDPLGARPLYYHLDPRRFAFASELSALLGEPGVPRVLDPGAVALWFQLGFVPEPATPLVEVRAVLPGEALLVEPGRIRARRYASFGAVAVASERAVAQLRESLEQAAGDGTRGETWIALSGGRVSSSLAVWARRRRPSAHFVTVALGQGPAAHAVEPGLEGTELAGRLEAEEAVRAALDAMDGPIGPSSFVLDVASAGALRGLPHEASPIAVGHGGLEAVLEPRPCDRARVPLHPSFAEGPAARAAGLGRRARRDGAGPTPEDLLLGLDPAVRLSSSELRRVDRMSVSAHRRFRAPFATPPVLEAALGIRGGPIGWGRLSRGVIPTMVTHRAHHRDRPPLDQWMRGPLNGLVEELLFDRVGGASGVLDSRRLRRWWYAHQLGVAERGEDLWRAVVFERWYRRLLLGDPSLPDARRRRRRPR